MLEGSKRCLYKMIARYAAPISYNFLNLINLGGGRKTIFEQDEKYWPLMPPLPSYGYGREHPGPRYGSLIHGQHLTDVTAEEVSFAANGITAAGLRAFSLA
ncbi:hypothetical protein JHK86_018237 [Glycine max]|nr:hypothetical protein JHK86_018237 [Glycine max]